MKLSKRTNAIILWVISIGLLVSMVIAFTPTVGGLFGSTGGGHSAVAPSGNSGDTPAILVNGKAVTELEVARALQNGGHSSFEGEVADDLQLVALDNLIQTEVLEQAASSIRVSDNEVRTAVNEWREQNNVAGRNNDQRYLSLIGQAGFDDQAFRVAFRDNLRLEKYREQLTENLEVSDAEAQAFYDLNNANYQSEARIIARQLVVEDEALATQLFEQATEGADFAELATENSVERAEQAGALGAPSDSTEPQAVGRAALPTPVATAAFGLQAAGLTDVIEFNNRYYLINVEEFVEAGTRPFDEVEEQVKEDALAAAEAQVLESTFTGLRDDATIEIPEASFYVYNDEAVATVGDEEIMRSELARVVYSDPQISQSLRPDTASIITGIFKPSYLSRLIDSEVAYQGASGLDTQFFGSKSQVAQSALNYVAKDATATDEELQEFYDGNLARFTIQARALVNRVNFAEEADATAFRDAIIAGGDLTELAEANNGDVIDLGTVNPGSLAPELDSVLFETEAFEAVADSENEVSDVLVLTETIEVPVEAVEETSDTVATDESEAAEDQEEDADSAATDESEEAEELESEETETQEASSEEATGDGENTVTEEIITTYTILVADRTPETIRSFEEVRSQVENDVLANKRSELQTEWLDGLKETIPVQNILAEAAAAEQAAEEPAVSFETTPLEEVDPDAQEMNSEDMSDTDHNDSDSTDTDESESTEDGDATDTDSEESSE